MIEVAVRCSRELVGGAVLVNEPRHLARVTHEVRRKLRRDHEIDRTSVALAEIEETPGSGVRENFALRVPLERHTDELGVVPLAMEFFDERAHVILGAATDERHLGFADQNRAQDRADAITWRDGT